MLPVMSAEAPEQVKSIRKLPTRAIVAITAAVMAGLFAGYQLLGDSMRWSDPAGFRACSMLADSIDRDGKIDGSLNVSFAIAEQAKESEILAIRASVFDSPGTAEIGYPRLSSGKKLHAACVAAGMDMPPVA